MDEKELLAVITKSGWKGAWEEQIEGLLSKIRLLETKGRYRKLLTSLSAANDRSNLLASVLEATIAFQFESAGIELKYEIRQDPDKDSSIDFCWKTATGRTAYIEVRLLQQDRTTADSIADQLRITNAYRIAKNGQDEMQDIVRVQRAILEKVQKAEGVPTKFVATNPNEINIVAVDASQIILGAFDTDDCKLVALGDPAVNSVYRRGIFGLFQEPRPEDPEFIQSRAQSFSRLRTTLHGLMFLFRRPQMDSFCYSLSQFLIWNRALIDERTAEAIFTEIEVALPTRSE
jgi:hypothetical protein